MLKVYRECCQNCLFSSERIVSPERCNEVVQTCTDKQTYFVCHKASMKNEEIVCKTFYDKFSHLSPQIILAKNLGIIEFVSQDNNSQLISHKKIKQQLHHVDLEVSNP